MTSITYTPEGAVSISYTELIQSPLSLTHAIETAFGSNPDCLGIIIVRDLPSVYSGYRDRLLKLSHAFAKLDESTRDKYADVQSRYSFGWSHGKEIMNGKPDWLKGSYYANPVVDDPQVSAALRELYPEYYSKNIWPTGEVGVEGFEIAFKELGRFIFDVGVALAVACQPFALSHLNDSSMSLPKLISTSNTVKARLLHYFPPSESILVAAKDEAADDLCGVHKDHSILTGLSSAMYLQNDGDVVPSPSPASGLYIRTRGGDVTKVSIPLDCLAFQTGEALEVATGGKLRATPHWVSAGQVPGNLKISRETFALFMQPDVDQILSPDYTFGQFSKRVFDEHYDAVA